MKKRAAVCISGHLRCLEAGFKNFKESIVDSNLDYDFDFFISTWDVMDWRTGKIKEKTYSSIEKIIELYDPVDISIEKTISWNTERFLKHVKEARWLKKGLGGKRSKGEHIPAMFYKIFKANCLKQFKETSENFKYDIVIRRRTDMGIYDKIDFNDLSSLDNNIYVLSLDQGAIKAGLLVRDVFAISSSRNMDYYSSVYINLDEIVNRTKIFRPEVILYNHLIQNKNINISQLDVKWHQM